MKDSASKFNSSYFGRTITRIVLMPVIAASLSIAMFLPVTQVYARSNDESGDQLLYIDDRYSEDIQPSRRTRGNCTDLYSKAWCDAHGFKNNRPVPGSVRLNNREKKCLFNCYVTMGKIVLAGVTKSPTGIYSATASAAYTLWVCSKM